MPPFPDLQIHVAFPFKVTSIKREDKRVYHYSKRGWSLEDDIGLLELRSLARRCFKYQKKKKLDGEEGVNAITVDRMISSVNTQLAKVRLEINNARSKIEKKRIKCLKEDFPPSRLIREEVEEENDDEEEEEEDEDEEELEEDDTSQDFDADIKTFVQEDQEFIEYLEKIRIKGLSKGSTVETTAMDEETNIFLTLPKTNGKIIEYEAYTCQICNGGDTNENNSIVFCSRCSVTVHQQCYRLASVPTTEWVCDLCQAFKEQGRYLACPMCTRKGGVMVETNCPSDLEYFKGVNQQAVESYQIQKGRKNRSRGLGKCV